MNPTPEKSRFVFIDALRGGAALAVLLFHLASINVFSQMLHRALGIFAAPLDYGKFGVQVFFVLSGFVIAHSLRNTEYSRGAIWNFIVRRQLRLDPPYWCVLVLALLLQFLETRMPALHREAMPDARAIGLNFFYAQYVFHQPSILNIAWTLCLEIQFYLAFIALLGVAALRAGSTLLSAALVFVSGALSLGFATVAPPVEVAQHHVWLFPFWFYFAAGVLCCWSFHQKINRATWWSFLVLWVFAIIAILLRKTPTDEAISVPALIVGLLSILMIDRAAQGDGLLKWGRGALWQYLGHISYSLYLIHVLVLIFVTRVGYKISGENFPLALFWLALAGVLSVIAAHALHMAIEKPSMKWASRFKRREYSAPEIQAD